MNEGHLPAFEIISDRNDGKTNAAGTVNRLLKDKVRSAWGGALSMGRCSLDDGLEQEQGEQLLLLRHCDKNAAWCDES